MDNTKFIGPLSIRMPPIPAKFEAQCIPCYWSWFEWDYDTAVKMLNWHFEESGLHPSTEHEKRWRTSLDDKKRG